MNQVSSAELGAVAHEWRERAQALLDRKTKPMGALGRLEAIAARLAGIQQTLEPAAHPARVLVFAADHGVAGEGVSAYPPEVTAQMMYNFAAGGAAINVISSNLGLEVEVVDVGVAADLAALDGIRHAKVRRGTRNVCQTAAMTRSEAGSAREAGAAAVRRAVDAGVAIVGIGEMGIANTTAAAAMLSALTGESPDRTVGRGTGVDDAGLRRKHGVVSRALARHEAGTDVLVSLGGYEIAAMAGAAQEAASCCVPVVVDGFIATVAVLYAVRECPDVNDALFFAHRSDEAGHGLALEALHAEPILDLGLRLGEGTGAALAIPLLQAAAAILRDMATFDQAGVSDKYS